MQAFKFFLLLSDVSNQSCNAEVDKYAAPVKRHEGFQIAAALGAMKQAPYEVFKVKLVFINFLQSSYFLIKSHNAESFGTNTVSLNLQYNISLFSNIIDHKKSFLRWRVKFESRLLYFLLSLYFLVESRSAESFKSISFTDFSAKFLMTSKINSMNHDLHI